MNKIIYKVHNDHIDFSGYLFECSSVSKAKELRASEIVEVTHDFFAPPAIRTADGELIFVPFDNEHGEHKKLPDFYAKNHIPVRDVTDIWAMILDPFLDTEHSDAYIAGSYAALEKYGVSRRECESLRLEVAARMVAYNFTSCLWEWVHLGLYDVLCASLGILSGDRHRLSNEEFKGFYWQAMEIALRGFHDAEQAI